jgi:hypothetical protein
LLLPRVAGALALRPQTYGEVAEDEAAGIQAGLLVVVVGILESSVLAAVHDEALDMPSVLYGVLAALIGWIVWSAILFAVAARLFEEPIDFRPLLRAVAFAHAPGLVYGLAALPSLTGWAGLLLVVSLLWFVGALFACVRGAVAVGAGRAAAITASALFAHEVLHQALRLGGLMP